VKIKGKKEEVSDENCDGPMPNTIKPALKSYKRERESSK